MKIYSNGSTAVSNANVWHAPKSNRVNIPAEQVNKHLPELNASGARFRVPSGKSISEMSDKNVKIPVEVFKDRVAVMLQRMALENQLNVEMIIPELAQKIYSKKDGMNLAAYNAALNLNVTVIPEKSLDDIEELLESRADDNKLNYKVVVDQFLNRIFPPGGAVKLGLLPGMVKKKDGESLVYGSVLDAYSRLNSSEMSDMRSTLSKAAKLCKEAAEKEEWLKDVFGKDNMKTAKEMYPVIAAKLEFLKNNMKTNISVDRNGDAEQMGVGGYALHQLGLVHLMGAIANQTDEDETLMTMIHEAAHLASASIDDLRYYGRPGFLSMTHYQKINNAAHYEEVPRRIHGNSSYLGEVFTPEKTASGRSESTEEVRRNAVGDKVQWLWKKAADVHDVLVIMRRQLEEGNKSDFEKFKPDLVDISKAFGLTLHTQSGNMSITGFDLVLIEGFVHTLHILKSKVGKMPVMQFESAHDPVREIILNALAQKALFLDTKQARDFYTWIEYHPEVVTRVNTGVKMVKK
ncbi:hypothetical protein [Chitinophaga sp. sic0106]|uniref:hypothetical protein n=1 Tax=Chitinophaga sp. sic0106 TaxID=2854785 RepID=UPI001C43BAC9|nr:hypothetical protein [Chitinophaga sp. sic0106]MBV7530807.1 hypothetical protein [Chitinophaga sp. sic0106]